MEELEKQLADILTAGRKHRRFLIPILQEVQSRLGYIPRQAMMLIAGFLDIPPSAVYGVATFYNQFRLTPRGKHEVNVCMGTACHLAGGSLVLDAMARELEISVGGVSADKQYGLERVACIGCCALAPVTVIDDKIFPHLNAQKVEEVLVNIKSANRASETAKQ